MSARDSALSCATSKAPKTRILIVTSEASTITSPSLPPFKFSFFFLAASLLYQHFFSSCLPAPSELLQPAQIAAPHAIGSVIMDTLVAQYTQPAYANEGFTSEEQDEYTDTLPPLSLKFALPPVPRPSAFLRAATDDYSNPNCPIKIAHGTTTLAFRFKGGIIVATDSRATAGNWIASQTVKKVIEINPMLLGTMAGGAAVC